MNHKLDKFIYLADVFFKHGYNLYLVGGSARDYLLNRPFSDFDVATDARPDEIEVFLPEIKKTFAKFGTVTYEFEKEHFDIATFRKESCYLDSRHPSQIEFVKDLKTDYKRRDFTINAIYIDRNLYIYDFGTSLSDLNNILIRTIGNPEKRLREDPLRILRAIRFSLVLDFEIEESLVFAINKYGSKLSEIKNEKIKEEIKKMKDAGVSIYDIRSEFKKFNVLPGLKI